MTSARLGAALAQLPPNARHLVQLGFGDGGLADAYKAIYPASFYQIIERDPESAARARRHCDLAHQADADTAGADFFGHFSMTDAWIVEGAFEHCDDPLRLLRGIRGVIEADACVLVITPAPRDLARPRQPPRYPAERLVALLRSAGFAIAATLALADGDAGARDFLIKAVPA